MITRIVKLTLEPELIENFMSVFHESSSIIRSYPGCKKMQLLKDNKIDHIYYTYSLWESEEHLNQYRNSDVFAGIWKKLKANFSAKAETVSLDLIDE